MEFLNKDEIASIKVNLIYHIFSLIIYSTKNKKPEIAGFFLSKFKLS
jgi:hypothetical protein